MRRFLGQSFKAALPIVVGYIALGLPCGILADAAGMSVLQVALLSVILYSGSGQYMIASLWLAGVNPLGIVAAVSMVNLRQLLYASSLLKYLKRSRPVAAIIAASNVTDESFGINIARFQTGGWTTRLSYAVNCWSQLTWIVFNIVGALVGSLVNIDAGIAAFAITAIFTCLLLMQKGRIDYVLAGIAAGIVVVICNFTGLRNVSIIVGAVAGIAVGTIAQNRLHLDNEKTESGDA